MVLAVIAAVWFDASVPGCGEWTGSSDADNLKYSLVAARPASDRVATVRFSAPTECGEYLPEPQGGVSLAAFDGSFWCLAEEDGTNTWARLSGAAPDGGDAVSISVSFRLSGDSLVARYCIGQTVLVDASSREWIPLAFGGDAAEVASFAFGGVSSVDSLAGDYESDGATVAFSCPAVEGAALVSASVAGTALEKDSSGAFVAPAGSVATLEFAAETGYLIGSPYAGYAVGYEDSVCPEDSLPRVYAAKDVIRINEIMASNGDTLATARGGKELDWIEIRNSAPFEVDLAGWYLFDGPDKKISKWTKIEGDCTIPSGGCKIVWADKSYESFDESEAYVRIGLSSSGEPLFIADTAGGLVHRVDFTEAIKDFSQGIGQSGGLVYYKAPTPGADNAEDEYTAPTDPVEFSVAHGYKTDSFEVEISCPANGEAEIRYTLDGTSPTSASTLYERPVAVSSTTCLRAAAVDGQSILQRDNAATYIFLDDVLSQDSSVPEGFPADGEVNGHAFRYGMDQSVVNGKDGERLVRSFTNGIDTVSIVIDPANLFDSQTGIYVNPQGDGREWERATMVEWITPASGGDGFSAPAGLRIRGGASRGKSYAKHSLRLFFRSSYGLSKLEYPLFGDEGASKFDKVDLRTSQNYSWANEDSMKDTFVHEVFSRDTQRDLGVAYTRSRYLHLFINGVYWGLYQTQERGDENFASTYLGGEKEDWDVVKTSDYILGASEGTIDAYRALCDFADLGFDDANYMRAQGLNPDGTRNPAYPVLLDPVNVMAYMLVAHYTVDADSPASVWGNHANNLYALRDRVDGAGHDGFVFLRHDAEHSMGTADSTDKRAAYCRYDQDPTGYGTSERHRTFASVVNFTPSELHMKLCGNVRYRMAFADMFYRECLREGGALTCDAVWARFSSRMAEIDDAVVAEAARWARKGQTRETWLAACGECREFIENRMPFMLAQYRARGWYPSVDPPVVLGADGLALADGCPVSAGGTFALAGNGEILYTLDGSDPMSEDGTVSGGAVRYSAPVRPPLVPATLCARVLSQDGEWSAMERRNVWREGYEGLKVKIR
jgi:hypothetical protein